MKKLFSLFLLLSLLVGCVPPKTSLTVFAAASLQEALDQVIAVYGKPVTVTYDSSGTLKTQIENGAPCDVFLSASPKQVQELEAFVFEDSQVNLLENKVCLAAAPENPGQIQSFAQLAEQLPEEDILLAVGNADVPVGQYTEKIFSYFQLDPEDFPEKFTYGSNAKEVTLQIQEGMVTCGIIYATDANEANLEVVDFATEAMCGQVIYPAALIRSERGLDFLNFLQTEEAAAIFIKYGFSIPS